jgi:transcriptional regulator with XRE-family HTH domain
MTTGGAELARTLRERRRELGLTRTRLAERSGLTAADIARWERGDEIPAPLELCVLADAVGLDEDETQRWIDSAVTIDITGPEVSVHIVDDDAPAPNPFAERIRLQRDRPRRIDRVLARIDELRYSKSAEASVSRIRSLDQPSRPAPSERSGLTRAPRPSVAPGVIPDVRRDGYDPVARVYSNRDSGIDISQEQAFYLSRRVGTSLALMGLALLLWWAVGALGEGVGDLFDLFRDGSDVGLPPSS